MAVADTNKAIGAVTRLLKDQLNLKTGLTVSEGRPQASSSPLNIFLYEISFDASMKNLPLEENQAAPLWLVLKYILTGFDAAGDSESVQAHDHLGMGLQALQELSILKISDLVDADIKKALKDNPEELKITLDEASSDLLSKLMQGPDEKYHFSAAFQVRPIMIAPKGPPSYAQLVGIDYTTPVPTEIGEEGIRLDVLPSLGPRIESIDPDTFELDQTITIRGDGFVGDDLEIHVGNYPIAPVMKQTERLEFVIPSPEPGDNPEISAGSHAIQVIQILESGRKRYSNLDVGQLLPHVDGVAFEASANPDEYGALVFQGNLLGGLEDDVVVFLWQAGKAVKVYSELQGTDSTQATLRVLIMNAQKPVAGTYRIILQVNGQKARTWPQVVLP